MTRIAPRTVYRDECRHFTGVGIGQAGHAKCCAAGVNYRALVGGEDFGWVRRLPCLVLPGDHDAASCDKLSLLTQAEHAQREADVRAAIDKAVAATEAGKCHVCGADAEPSKVVGRCRYAACGHRVGQVDTGGD